MYKLNISVYCFTALVATIFALEKSFDVAELRG